MLSTLRTYLSPRTATTGMNVACRYIATALNVSNWPSGSDWDVDQLVSLKLQVQFEQNINQILPISKIPFNTLNQSILTPFATSVYNYDSNSSSSNQLEEFMVSNLLRQAKLVEDRKKLEDLTTQFVAHLFTLFNLSGDEDRLQVQVVKRIPIGGTRIITKLDAVVGHELQSAVGMEVCIVIAMPSVKIYENLYNEEFKPGPTNTEPQIAAHLLGMAMMALGSRISNHEPITVHLIEIHGSSFKFWKATFPYEYLEAVSMGEEPMMVVPLFYHQKAHTSNGGYKFTDPADRKTILELLGTYFSYALHLQPENSA